MNESYRRIIEREARRIRERLKDSRLFGETLDLNDADAVIWCAFLLAKQDERLKENTHYERLDD